MTDNEDKLINEYEIVREHKTIYTYKGYKYDKLEDAINFAKSNATKKNS